MLLTENTFACCEKEINVSKLLQKFKSLYTILIFKIFHFSFGKHTAYVVGSKSFRPEIQKPRRM